MCFFQALRPLLDLSRSMRRGAPSAPALLLAIGEHSPVVASVGVVDHPGSGGGQARRGFGHHLVAPLLEAARGHELEVGPGGVMTASPNQPGESRRGRSLRTHFERRREQARVTQLVLRRLPRTIRQGDYPEAIRPFVNDMEREAAALVQHLGGESEVSEVQAALIRDAVIAGATLAVAFTRVI